MKYVYVVIEKDEHNVVTIIGVYTSQQKAVDVIESLDSNTMRIYEKIPLNEDMYKRLNVWSMRVK